MLQWHSDPIIVPADKAVPLGLMVNELVKNFLAVSGPACCRSGDGNWSGLMLREASGSHRLNVLIFA